MSHSNTRGDLVKKRVSFRQKRFLWNLFSPFCLCRSTQWILRPFASLYFLHGFFRQGKSAPFEWFFAVLFLWLPLREIRICVCSPPFGFLLRQNAEYRLFGRWDRFLRTFFGNFFPEFYSLSCARNFPLIFRPSRQIVDFSLASRRIKRGWKVVRLLGRGSGFFDRNSRGRSEAPK